MRLEEVKGGPPTYEAVGPELTGSDDNPGGRTLAKEKTFWLNIEQKHFNNWNYFK